jgi:hypothetical protein
MVPASASGFCWRGRGAARLHTALVLGSVHSSVHSSVNCRNSLQVLSSKSQVGWD